jgi:putative transposase
MKLAPSARNWAVWQIRFDTLSDTHLRRKHRGRRSCGEVCRKFGITEQTFYRWKRKFSGIGIVELHCLKQLERENRKLKFLVADLELDKHMLQEMIAQNL